MPKKHSAPFFSSQVENVCTCYLFVHVIWLYMSKEVVWLVQRSRLTSSKKSFDWFKEVVWKCFSSRCLMDVSLMTVTKKIFCHKLYDREKKKNLPYITWPRKKKFCIDMTAKKKKIYHTLHDREKKNFALRYLVPRRRKKKILPYITWPRKKKFCPTLSGPKTSFDWSKKVVWLVQKSRLTGPKKSFDWSKEVVWLVQRSRLTGPKKSFDWSKKVVWLVQKSLTFWSKCFFSKEIVFLLGLWWKCSFLKMFFSRTLMEMFVSEKCFFSRTLMEMFVSENVFFSDFDGESQRENLILFRVTELENFQFTDIDERIPKRKS